MNPLTSQWKNQMILAPLTRGGNLPFRRLCADFGMSVSMSEMVYARFLIKGDPTEQARLRRASNEECFGVQIATNDIHEGKAAISLAAQNADFIDLNCGCPIYEATRRGLGSALLRSPEKLGKLDTLGRDASSVNVLDIARAVREAGASALTIHGRTAIQGYHKAADWSLIQQIVEENQQYDDDKAMCIVGNGDIFTHWEAHRRIEETGVDAVMVGRGALIKPWIFQEFQQRKSWEPDLEERIAIYRRLTCYMKDHFGDDELGRKKSWNFLPWHLDFLARYTGFPDAEYAHVMSDEPLIQRRKPPSDNIAPLGLLLEHGSKATHERIAGILWDSTSDKEAVANLQSFAESKEFETIQNCHEDDGKNEETTELANIRSGGKWRKRRGRSPKPQRTPEEIAAIRAERAAKKARLAMEETNAAEVES
ncbi:synthase [Seminavis robusta]|uniref:tRNA-dihydrouridine(47) synthase [NAD(P)(+)] n=1 Tax=Seminavis robusta TaxID=568900 RepID=A0A9N8EWK0_9STRA|nr:synthase [Seminavis robusta]|eukprot:Sro2255_g321010.1 synthase (424) ;mRNA; r:14923-16238